MERIKRITAFLLCLSLVIDQPCFAQVASVLDISAQVVAVARQPAILRPAHLRSLSYQAAKEQFSVRLDQGDQPARQRSSEVQVSELLTYFLVGISLPDEAFWVNLNPEAESKMIDPALASTDVGRILLEADLQLKKDTAQCTSPRTVKGKQYWERLYKKAQELYGSSQITIPTIARPWIVPGEIILRESADNAYIYKANLEVKLESDHLKGQGAYSFADRRQKELNEYAGALMKELVLPELAQAVNTGRAYAGLRQLYFSLILAKWFKRNFHGKPGAYAARIESRNLTGLGSKSPWSPAAYFTGYKKSFSQGEYNIKEEVITSSGSAMRTYFSGGISAMEGMRFDIIQGGKSLPAGKGISEFEATEVAGELRLTFAPAFSGNRTFVRAPAAPVKRDGGQVIEQGNSDRFEVSSIHVEGGYAEMVLFDNREKREEPRRLQLEKSRRAFKGSVAGVLSDFEHQYYLVKEVFLDPLPDSVTLHVYREMPGQVFGFIDGDTICMQEDMSRLSGALLHMAGEYLVKNGKIRLVFEEGSQPVIIVHGEGREPARVRLGPAALEQAGKGADTHNLLMALQLEIADMSTVRMGERVKGFEAWQALKSIVGEEEVQRLASVSGDSLEAGARLAILLKDMGIDSGSIYDVVEHCCVFQYYTAEEIEQAINLAGRCRQGGLSPETIMWILARLSGGSGKPIPESLALTHERIALLSGVERTLMEEKWSRAEVAGLLVELVATDFSRVSKVLPDQQALRRFARYVARIPPSRRPPVIKMLISAASPTGTIMEGYDEKEQFNESLILLAKTAVTAAEGGDQERFVDEWLQFSLITAGMFPDFPYNVLLEKVMESGSSADVAQAIREFAVFLSERRKLYPDGYSQDYFSNMLFAALENKAPLAALAGIREDAGLGGFIADGFSPSEREAIALAYGNLVKESDDVKSSLNRFSALITALKEKKQKDVTRFLFQIRNTDYAGLFQAIARSPDINSNVDFVMRLNRLPLNNLGLDNNQYLFKYLVESNLSSSDRQAVMDFCRWYCDFEERQGLGGKADLDSFFRNHAWRQDAAFILAPGNAGRFEDFLARCPSEEHLNGSIRMEFYFELFAWLGAADPALLDGFIRGDVTLQQVAVTALTRGRERGHIIEGVVLFFPLAVVSRALSVNIKVVRYIRGKPETLPLIQKLDEPEFRRRIQSIAYSLNREVTLSPAERRINEDDKTNLFDLLFSSGDLTYRGADVFEAFFRNDSRGYVVDIPQLIELLSNVEITEVNRIIRAIKENPKESIDEVAETLKQQFTDPRTQARIIWILENFFVLEDRLDALQGLVRSLAGKGAQTTELIALLRHIDNATTFARLSVLASGGDNSGRRQMLSQVLAFKIESLMTEEREDFICEAMCAFDSLDDRELARELLLEHLNNLPESSRLRVLIKVLYVTASKNNAIVAVSLRSLHEGKPVKGQEIAFSRAALIAEIFNEVKGITIQSRESRQPEKVIGIVLGYMTAAEAIQDTWQRKEALNQLGSLFIGRQYSAKRLAPESSARATLERLSAFLAVDQREHKIPHVFFQPLLTLLTDDVTYEHIRKWCELVNTTGSVRNQTARLKNDLYEKIRSLASFGNDQNGVILRQVIGLTFESFEQRNGPLTGKNLEQFNRELFKNLEEMVMVVGVHEQAAKNGLDPSINAMMLRESAALLDGLTYGKLFDPGKMALIRGLDSHILLATLSSSLGLTPEEAEICRKQLVAYSASPRFTWQDHQGRNLYRLVDEYLRTFINFKPYSNEDQAMRPRYQELVRVIYEALMHETAGDFKEWRYRSPDYIATIDEIIRIEVSRLPAAQQAEFERLTAAIEAGTLAEKLEAIDGFDAIKQRIARIRAGWETDDSFALPSDNGQRITWAGDFGTLFNIGNYPGSTACQSCTYISTLKAGLSGYVTHGTNKAIALLDPRDIIMSRRIVRLRIVADDRGRRQPVIFVEEKAQHGSLELDRLYAALAAVSSKTGLPVVYAPDKAVSQVSGLEGTDSGMRVVVFKGRAFDYSDTYDHPDALVAGLHYQETDMVMTGGRLYRTLKAFRGAEEEILRNAGLRRSVPGKSQNDGGTEVSQPFDSGKPRRAGIAHRMKGQGNLPAGSASGRERIGGAEDILLPNGIPLQGTLGQIREEIIRAGGMDEKKDAIFLNHIGTSAGFRVKTVYNPFGGFDPATAFALSGGRELFSVGLEDFGTLQDMATFFSRAPIAQQRAIVLRKFDSLDDMKSLEKAYGLTGLGSLAILRLVASLDARVTSIRYFELGNDGTVYFIDPARSARLQRGRNCCVTFTSDGESRRYWYIQHDVLREDPGFSAFMGKLRFEGMLIKAVPRMWDWDALFMLDLGTRQDWIRFIREVNAMTIIPAVREKARILSDIDLAVGGRYGRTLGPHPIFRETVGSILLGKDQQFGYSREGDHLYFGEGRDLRPPLEIEREFMRANANRQTKRDHCADILVNYYETKKDKSLSSAAGAYIYMFIRRPDRAFRELVGEDELIDTYTYIFDFLEQSLMMGKVNKAHPVYRKYGKLIDAMLKAELLSGKERLNLRYIVKAINEGLHRYSRFFAHEQAEKAVRDWVPWRDGGKPQDVGGVDFRQLPVPSIPRNAAEVFKGITPSTLALDVDAEWAGIQGLVNTGIVPSCQRIREYAGACYSRGILSARAGQLLVFLADVLRLQEGRNLPTEKALRDILTLLEAA